MREVVQRRSGSITFGDLDGRLDVLRVTCSKCDRVGRYSVARLIERHGGWSRAAGLEGRHHRRLPQARQAGRHLGHLWGTLPGPQRGAVRERAVSRGYDEEATKPLAPRLEPPPPWWRKWVVVLAVFAARVLPWCAGAGVAAAVGQKVANRHVNGQ